MRVACTEAELQGVPPEVWRRAPRDARGRAVNSGYFYSLFGNALDATHPAVPEHLERLGRTLREHGRAPWRARVYSLV